MNRYILINYRIYYSTAFCKMENINFFKRRNEFKIFNVRREVFRFFLKNIMEIV